ncbi:MAG: glutathione S-transferase [Pseudomonadota bacterium]
MSFPILYSFRRCPYAMRARLAIASAGVTCELREIVLKNKAPEFLAASPKGTVPVIVDGTRVIEESLDIMDWALSLNDPENWLSISENGQALINVNDGPFKLNLDRYKYATRHKSDPEIARDTAAEFLRELDSILAKTPYLDGDDLTLADFAILPFVRQYANTDRTWFNGHSWPHLVFWLEEFLASPRFASIMQKHVMWQRGDPTITFP